MKIEINVTYVLSTQVEVPAELAPDKDFNYPNSEAFDEWVAARADELCEKTPVISSDAWTRTEAYETEHWHEVYCIS